MRKVCRARLLRYCRDVTSTVVFDLDRVLVSGNAVTLFARGLLRCAPRRALWLFCLAPLIALVATVAPLRPLCARVLIWLAVQDQSGSSDDVAGVYREALARWPQAAMGDAVACVRAHRAAGQQVVVATSTEESLARGFLTALGLGDVEVVGSTGSLWAVSTILDRSSG
jgi:phosphatidylglycerophosphatase C